jgi:hypothetical protein
MIENIERQESLSSVGIFKILKEYIKSLQQKNVGENIERREISKRKNN